jgi:mycofactocin glycosyltransferase
LRPSASLVDTHDPSVLLGGSPLRLMTLSERGEQLVTGWWGGEPVGENREDRLLARRLLSAGLADPEPPPDPPAALLLTVIVPVYERAEELRACLSALGREWPVIVVDDGSPNPAAIAAAAREFGANCVRLERNAGPSAARNAGLALATTPLVAFVDSDCRPSAQFPGRLLSHFDDPLIGAVAPRIVPLGPAGGTMAAYEARRSPLDMGPHAARVRPWGRGYYVPSAALILRRDAAARGFDEALDMGEDVDLVWRLHDAGWQVRYDPQVTVAHDHRVELVAWCRRRVAYNASVAPLLRRHPGRLQLLYLSPAAGAAWAAALAGRPEPILTLAAARVVGLRQVLASRARRPTDIALRLAGGGTLREGRELVRALAGAWAGPALAALWLRRRRKPARRLGALVAGWLLLEWLDDRPTVDPPSYALLRLTEEASRGAGVWLGCARERDLRALLPGRPPKSRL